MKTLSYFRHQLNEFDQPTIYCDMDGVLADFLKFTGEFLGRDFKDSDWSELPDNTYALLPPMPDAKQLWGFIGKYDPFILTAYPKAERGPISKRAPEDKTIWMKKHFGVPKSRMLPVMRKDKQQFAIDGRDGRPNLLIDDHADNIKQFRAKGGLGIVHTSAANTIRELKKLGYQ